MNLDWRNQISEWWNLKIDDLKTILSFWDDSHSGAMWNFWGVTQILGFFHSVVTIGMILKCHFVEAFTDLMVVIQSYVHLRVSPLVKVSVGHSTRMSIHWRHLLFYRVGFVFCHKLWIELGKFPDANPPEPQKLFMKFARSRFRDPARSRKEMLRQIGIIKTYRHVGSRIGRPCARFLWGFLTILYYI